MAIHFPPKKSYWGASERPEACFKQILKNGRFWLNLHVFDKGLEIRIWYIKPKIFFSSLPGILADITLKVEANKGKKKSLTRWPFSYKGGHTSQIWGESNEYMISLKELETVRKSLSYPQSSLNIVESHKKLIKNDSFDSF